MGNWKPAYIVYFSKLFALFAILQFYIISNINVFLIWIAYNFSQCLSNRDEMQKDFVTIFGVNWNFSIEKNTSIGNWCQGIELSHLFITNAI